MWKKGPKEKEKILKRLTEKEIQEQLYGFRARQTPGISVAASAKDIIKETQPLDEEASLKSKAPQQAKELPPKPIEAPKNPYLVWQMVLLVIFLILIWISIRQIIRFVAAVSYSQPNISKQSPQFNLRGRQFKTKGGITR